MNVMLLCFLYGFALASSKAFQMCCPNDWILYKYRSLDTSQYYDCVEPHQILDIELDKSCEILGAVKAPLGYGLEYWYDAANPTNITLPKCNLAIYNNISLKGEMPVNILDDSCLVIVNNHLWTLSCGISDNESLASVEFINKCCPHGYIYSSDSFKCIEGTPNFNSYANLLNNVTIFRENSFKCAFNRVLVEYTITPNTVNFNGYQLIWNDKSRIVKTGDFCIEAVVDVEKERNASKLQHEQEFLVRICQEKRICNSLPCIRRCCDDGEIYQKGNRTTYCKRDESDIPFQSFTSLQISGNFTKPSEFGVLRGLDCPKFRLDPDEFSDETHTISSTNGTLLINKTRKIYTNSQYCVEKIRNSTAMDQKLYTFVCFDSKVLGNDQIRFKLYPIGLLISCCFYALTLMIYGSIAKLRNLPGKILICLVCSLFMAYLGIALGQLMPTSNDNVCFISGFFVYFCLMAAFSWMNVTCFDIYQTFGTTWSKRLQNQEQSKLFIWYSLYGWGLPTLLTTLTVALIKSDVLPDSIRPNFGHGRCWFTYDTIGFASLVFFSGPVGFLFLINLALFLQTLRYCNKVKREIYRMQSSNCEKPALKTRFFMHKTRFAMNTKLCVVMGITWLLEIASILFYDHKKTFFWSISDSFNVLLGVFVFFIFVFKRRIWHEILLKLGVSSETERRRNANTTYATQSTYAQSMTMTKLAATEKHKALLRKNSNSPSAVAMI